MTCTPQPALDAMLDRHNGRFGAADNLTVLGVAEDADRYFLRVRKRAGGNVVLPSLAAVEAFLAGVTRSAIEAAADLDALAEVFADGVAFDAFTLGFRICGGSEVEPLALAA